MNFLKIQRLNLVPGTTFKNNLRQYQVPNSRIGCLPVNFRKFLMVLIKITKHHAWLFIFEHCTVNFYSDAEENCIISFLGRISSFLGVLFYFFVILQLVASFSSVNNIKEYPTCDLFLELQIFENKITYTREWRVSLNYNMNKDNHLRVASMFSSIGWSEQRSSSAIILIV